MSQPDTNPTMEKLRVLNLENDENDSGRIRAELKTGWKEIELMRVNTREAFVRALEEFKPDMVLCDFRLPGFDGCSALDIVRQTHPNIPAIIITDTLADSEVVKLLRMGARDYVMKNRLQRLVPAVRDALLMEQGIRVRKAAEKAVRQNEANLRALIEHSPVAMIVDVDMDADADEKILMMNQKFTELFGYTMADVPDVRHWWQLAYPDEKYREGLKAEWTKKVEKAIQNHGSIEPMEVTVACKDGSNRYIRISLSSIGGKNIIAFEDLTERKRAEEELERFFNLIPDMVCIASAEGYFLKINPAWQALLGYTMQEILGKNFLDLIHPDDRAATMNEVKRQLAGKATMQFSNRYRCKDGSYIWLEWETTPAIDGKLLFASARDITERKQAEDRLAESEEKFRKITESAQDAIIMMGADQRISFWNTAAERIFGYTAAEATGQELHALITPAAARAGFAQAFPHFRETGEGPIIGVVRGVTALRKSGKEFPAELSVSATRLDGMWYAIGIVRDITGRKKLEGLLTTQYQHLKVAHERLLESSKQLQLTQSQLLHSAKMASIGLLAAGVAHEINNPIGYVNSNMGTLEKYLADIFAVIDKFEAIEMLMGMLVDADDPLLEELRQFKEQINLGYIREDIKVLLAESHQGLERVKKIVLDLKNFSHADSEDRWMWADMHHVLDTTLNVMWNELKYKCEVVKEFGVLPEIYCLPSQLEQVFMNLLENAAHAIEVRGKITIRTGQEGDRIWVEVSDTGKGIPPEDFPHLFDPFFTTKPVGKGTGLGLSVSYSIVEKHHGKIEVRSEVGKGSVFRVWLPVQQPDIKEKA